MNNQHWPTELKLAKDKRSLTVAFDDGVSVTIPAELLRVESPSAEVQGHGPSQKKTIPGKRNVEIIKIEPVGHYAVKLVFDDMHDTGIYGWDTLREMGQDQEKLMQAYFDALEAQGLSREPALRRK
ncbi:MAG: gamma-butyrobetaine hydroxylase-like domain-containing protein [Bosea sp. (in: a-proteobacteria)]